MEPVRKHSQKRDAILSCLRGTTCHPTAEWVYQQLKPAIPDLSLGTVYRNLAMFKKTGELRSVGIVDGMERFDANTAPHAHLICTCCDAVLDAHGIELPPEILHSAAAATKAHVTGYQILFYGLCPKCLETHQN